MPQEHREIQTGAAEPGRRNDRDYQFRRLVSNRVVRCEEKGESDVVNRSQAPVFAGVDVRPGLKVRIVVGEVHIPIESQRMRDGFIVRLVTCAGMRSMCDETPENKHYHQRNPS